MLTPLSYPADAVFTREQAAALRTFGHRVTVVAPGGDPAGWAGDRSVDHVVRDWASAPATVHHVVAGLDADVAHVHATRGHARPVPVPIPSVTELLTVSLRRWPIRQLVSARTAWNLRHEKWVAAANPRMVGPGRPANLLVPNGYSTWAPEVAGRREPVPGLSVYQGTFSPLRRLDQMLQAFAQVARARPDATLLLVGGDDPAQIQRTTHELGLTDRVTVATSRERTRLVEAMSRASATVVWVPRRFGFDDQPPLKLLDGMAADVPVVATNTRASVEIVDRYGGATLTDADVGSFAEAWIRVLDGGTGLWRDREAFLHERSWTTIVRDHWMPRYQSLIP